MNFKKRGAQTERYGFLGFFLFIIGLAGIAALLLFVFKEQLIQRGLVPSHAWTIWGGVSFTLFLGLLIMKFWWRLKQATEHVFYRPQKSGKASSEAHVRSPVILVSSEIKASLRRQYGFFRARKLGLLLLSGSAADVERLVPGLTTQFWLEDSGTLVLWCGQPGAPEGSILLRDLCRLRRCPFDGVVWVTSALEESFFSGEQRYQAKHAAATADSAGQALGSLYALIGWRLPLYVWSLHTGEGMQPERVTQSVGCLLPAACNGEQLAHWLSCLLPELVSQGTQQICGHTRYQFLLRLAEQLSCAPSSVAEPLGALLSSYHPLPLAGVMFSPATVDAKHTEEHRWRPDKRWDVLLDSLTSLPAALRHQ